MRSNRLEPKLRAEVERQLLSDLEHYGVSSDGLSIDWSGICHEGHGTWYMDGRLDSSSGLSVINQGGEVVAEGWFDFIHGGDDEPLFVFWLFLTVIEGISRIRVKKTNLIPRHIWDRLFPQTKNLCLRSEIYDARWCRDPLVIEWQQQRTE